MPTYTLRGVDIEFPYEAYDCQIAYMEQVVKALQDGTNALLESPTGTGKTLCLLCATLAWRKWNRKRGGGASGGVGNDGRIGAAAAAAAAASAAAPSSSNSVAAPTWAQAMRDAVANAQTAEDNEPGHRGAPPIVYASRTHSQLAQAMAELRRTAYAPETTAVALGSRAQLCCNPAVATLGSGAAANQACSAAVRSGSCGWHSRVDGFLRDNPGAASVGLGLEELHRLAGDNGRGAGGGTGPCPFYVSRGLAPTADVVFVPYNYLVDPRSRAGLRQLAWRGAVVVFDEAHNLEGAAADAASFDLTAPALAAAIDEAGLAANAAQRRSESGEAMSGGGGGGGGGAGDRRGQRPAAAPTSTMGSSSADAGTGPPDYGSMARDLRLLSGVLKGLESAIARAAEGLLPPETKGNSSSSSSFGGGGGGGAGAGGASGAAAGKTFPAQFLFDLLGSVGITPSSMLPLGRLMDDASDLLAEEAARNGSRAAGGGGAGGGAALAALADCLRLAFESSEPPSIISSAASSSQNGRPGASTTTVASPAAAESYRVHLWRSASPSNNNNSASSSSSAASAPPSNRRWSGTMNNNNSGAPAPPASPAPSSSSSSSTPTLSYWCFSAGVALRAVAAAGARSLLLTSGTLSPLPALAAELSPLRFPVTLENPHVVPDSHVWASVVSSGPMGTRLNSSFRTRESAEYKSDLGCLVAAVAASSPGGLLVFFPSYAALGSAVSHWKSARAPAKLAPPYSTHASTIWDAICWAKGRVFVEPRGSAGGSGAFASAVLEYRAALAAPGSRGAAFLAVCRGKASEGLDFSDDAARAVIVTGLPYALATDARVSIKRAVLDESARKILAARGSGSGNKRPAASGNGTTSSSTTPPPPLAPLTGEAWYVQQAARAVNQAVGRVIRHVGDYGAIILADERFAFGGSGKASAGAANAGGGFGPRSQLSAWVRRLLATPNDFDQAMGSLAAFFRARYAASGGAAGGAAGSGGGRAASATGALAPRLGGVGTLRPAFAPPPSNGGANNQQGGGGGGGGASKATPSGGRRGINTAGLAGLMGERTGNAGAAAAAAPKQTTTASAAAAATQQGALSLSSSALALSSSREDDGVVERLLAGLESGSAFSGGAATGAGSRFLSSSAAAAAAAAPPPPPPPPPAAVAPVFSRAAAAASSAPGMRRLPTAIPSGLPPSRPVVESVGPRPPRQGQGGGQHTSRPPLAAKQQQESAAAAVPAAHPPAAPLVLARNSQQNPSDAAPPAPQTQQSQQPSSSTAAAAAAAAGEASAPAKEASGGGGGASSVHSYLAALKAGLPAEDHARVTAALRAYRPGGGERTAGDAARLISEVAAVLGAPPTATAAATATTALPPGAPPSYSCSSRLPLLKGFGRFMPQAYRAAFERVVAEAEAAVARAAAAARPAEGTERERQPKQQQQQQRPRPTSTSAAVASSNPFFSASAAPPAGAPRGGAPPRHHLAPPPAPSASRPGLLPRTGPGGRALPAQPQRPAPPASVTARGGVAGPGGSLLPPGGGGSAGSGANFSYDQRRPGEIGGRRPPLLRGGPGQRRGTPAMPSLPSSFSQQQQQQQQQQQSSGSARALAAVAAAKQRQQQQQQQQQWRRPQ